MLDLAGEDVYGGADGEWADQRVCQQLRHETQARQPGNKLHHAYNQESCNIIIVFSKKYKRPVEARFAACVTNKTVSEELRAWEVEEKKYRVFIKYCVFFENF